MKITDLKPCPFCGSDRITVWNIRDGQQAVCKECKSTGTPTFHGKDGRDATWGHAVEAWNRRAPLLEEAASDDVIGYVLRYGGMCRDCADMDGVCQSGQPCDTDQRRAVAKHTIAALAYGIEHGFIANPFTAALAEQTQQGVEVKKLEWDQFTTSTRRHFQANTILGQFQIGYLGEFECWQLYSPQKSSSWKECFSRHASPDEAKAAAQSDYETRIRSALVDVPAVIPTANCCICGRIIDTREKSEGGDDHGDETAPGKWTCSVACYDAFTGYVPDVPAVESEPVVNVIPSWKDQAAFEEWAATERYEMQQHPLHYLFLDAKTAAARKGWKAGMAFALSTRKGSAGDGSATTTKGCDE